MRYWVYDENGKLFRKFEYRDNAVKFLQAGWKLVVKPEVKPDKPAAPTPETHGEAKW